MFYAENSRKPSAVTIRYSNHHGDAVPSKDPFKTFFKLSNCLIILYNIRLSYARCDWSVTVFISGHANTVVTSQHISQSYFIKENRKFDALYTTIF